MSQKTTTKTIAEWAGYHADLFGMTSESDVRMLTSWVAPFTGYGFTADELVEASQFMAIHDEPQFRNQHLGGIKSRIANQRQKARATARGTHESKYGSCSLCSDCGFATVPGAGCVTHGGNTIPSDSLTTVAVLCSCWAGRNMAANQDQKKPMRTLEDYSREFPGWKDDMDRIRGIRAQDAKLSSVASGLDKTFGPILKKLRKKAEAS